MKKQHILLLSFLFLLLTFSCKKHNPEDPRYPHLRHLNNRLEGEWELVSLHVSNPEPSANLDDIVYENFSNLLDIDTMNIAKFFKFVPQYESGKVSGGGDLYIKTKNMGSYPEKVGISQSMVRDLNDTNVALAQLTYKFLEGSTDKDYFKFDVKALDTVDFLTSSDAVFKPFDEYFLFNNFYFRYFYNFEIMKATNKELILSAGVFSSETIEGKNNYRKYRLTFKKVK